MDLLYNICNMVEVPSHQFSDKELKFSYWYITNKLILRRYLIIFLSLLSLSLWGFVVYSLVFYVIDLPTEQYLLGRLMTTPAASQAALEALKPLPLQIGELEAIGGENNRYDFISSLANPNKNWLATFNYRFVDSESDPQPKRGFILPLEQKYLFDLGHENSDGRLEISDLSWQKVFNAEYAKDDKYRFTISDEQFIAGQQAGDPNRLVFKLSNDSAYGYWGVGVQAYLYSGGNLASINYITLSQVRAGEQRTVEIDWNYKLPRIDSFEIIPELNVFDQDNVMPAGQ